MILITYWFDEDPDTITSVMCDNTAECEKIVDVLMKWNADIITTDELSQTITAEELNAMFTDIYNMN